MSNKLTRFFDKNRPEILMVTGLILGAGAVVTAITATPKAHRILCGIKEEASIKDEPKKVIKEVFTKVVPLYLPSLGLEVASVCCVIGGNSVNRQRTAAITAAYGITQTAFKTYRNNVVDEIGKKAEKKIFAKSSDEKIKKLEKSHPIMVVSSNKTLFYDTLSGRPFESDMDTLYKIENLLNRRMRSEMYVSVNDMYYEMGLDPVTMGDSLGFNIDRGYIEFEFSPHSYNDQPCFAIDYCIEPKADYMR